MKRMATELMKLAMVLGAGTMLSGFTAGGCGGFEVPRCETLNEQQCAADPACAPQFTPTACACAPCAPDAKCMPCNCPSGGFAGCHLRPTPPPPSGCSAMGELECLQHPECRANYGGDTETQPAHGRPTKKGGRPTDPSGCAPPPPEQGFLSCEPAAPICPAVMCMMDCPHGSKVDARGCELCECNEVACSSDQDCAADETCVERATQPATPDCGANGMACPTRAPTGTCNKVSPSSCKTDADCGYVSDESSGKRCETHCGNGWCDGICVAASCDSAADCSAGQSCIFPTVTCPPNALCAPPRGSCSAITCASDRDCAGGTTCQADPGDPCSKPGTQCKIAARTICQPPPKASKCAGLDEKSCTVSGCSAVYGASACSPDGTCTTDMVFKRCE